VKELEYGHFVKEGAMLVTVHRYRVYDILNDETLAFLVTQCRQLSYHQECIGIAGLRGVRFLSPTEQDIDDWHGCNM
jgi:hypothetical protein